MMDANAELDATHKDYAEFYLLMLDQRRRTVDDVVAWADSVIEASQEAPDWAIELSLSKRLPIDEVMSLLRHVPGGVTDDLPRKMAAALLSEEWLTGRLSDDGLVSAWFRLWPVYPRGDPDAEHACDVSQYLDEVIESLRCGDRIPVSWSEAHRELAKRLDPYRRYLPLVDRLV